MPDIDLKHVKTAYFIGIGGIGISAIARMLLAQGIKVYGSDRDASKVTNELTKAGATVFIGQKKENILDISEKIDLFVYTVAIPEENQELAEARSREQKQEARVLTYPQMLGVVSKEKFTIAVSGTHGKTTTTAMIAKVLIDAGLDPSVIVGSLIKTPHPNPPLSRGGENTGMTNFIEGKSKYLVVEADEYRKSFHNLYPSILVINNLDEDHLDFYKDLADIQDSFLFLAQRLPKGGALVVNSSDPHVAPIVEKNKARLFAYQNENLSVVLKVPGEHNRSNAKAALAVAHALDLDLEKAETSLSEFTGAWRRFEYKGTTKSGVIVYDDYAHNPQKIKALLSGAREYFGKEKRIVVVFQPHLFSRTKSLFKEFTGAFGSADSVIFAPIFPAREVFDPSISSDMIAVALREKGKQEVYSYSSFEEIEGFLPTYLKKDDVFITVGAGEAYKIGDNLLS